MFGVFISGVVVGHARSMSTSLQEGGGGGVTVLIILIKFGRNSGLCNEFYYYNVE